MSANSAERLPPGQLVLRPPWLSPYLPSWPSILGLVVAALALLAMLSWMVDLGLTPGLLPGKLQIRANASLAFTLMGAGLFSLGSHPFTTPWRRATAFACALGAIAIGSATLAEYLFRTSFGIDNLLVLRPGALMLSLRAPVTPAVGWGLTGIGLVLLPHTRLRQTVQALALSIFAVGFLALALVTFGLRNLPDVPTPFASLFFCLISVGILMSNPEAGIVGLLRAQDLGGTALRRLLPAVLLVPFLLGLIKVLGERGGLISDEAGTAMVATASVALFSVLTFSLAGTLSRSDAERQQAHAQVRALNRDLERRVTERTTELQAANGELEAFSYSVSHDLRAPLRSIDGFSRMVIEDFGPQLPVEGQRYLKVVRDSTRLMGALIDDLLAFARLGRQPLNKGKVDVAALASQVIEELGGDREGRELKFTVGDLPPCQGDPALLRQVFANLISNAIKFTRERGSAAIKVGYSPSVNVPATASGPARAERRVYFVGDNGIGFDSRYADRIFGVFQRLHRAEDYEGTGVGLAIVQRIVNRHGGRIWADGGTGKGATFYFTLEAQDR